MKYFLPGLDGLIPARAGSTPAWKLVRWSRWAHPRPCGEHDDQSGQPGWFLGSSPPVRGAPVIQEWALMVTGLIPARAGSTTSIRPRSIRTRAHPRPCGEHGGGRNSESLGEGSSPPVRGALTKAGVPLFAPGLIPARAGSTLLTARLSPAWRAHPRPCGEHVPAARPTLCLSGSSPPVRGAPHARPVHPRAYGLIPARAGSTHLRVRREVGGRAHPRPCGEHACVARRSRAAMGSSPPVRGALF